MKRIIEFIVYTNIWVAIAVSSLCWFTGLLIENVDFNFIYFSFFATLLMYAYARWFSSPSREDDATSKLTDWASHNRLINIASGLIGAVGAIWFALSLNRLTLIWLLICGGISALYPLQFFKHGQLALRNIAGLKLFVISAIWAIVTVILPVTQVNQELSFDIILLTIQRFLFVMAITIPFDIRDLRIDHPDINTLPYRMGVKASRNFALLTLLIAEGGAVFMFFSHTISIAILIGQLIAYEITSLFIYRSSPNKPDLFFSFGVEGTSVLLFLMVYIFNYFWP